MTDVKHVCSCCCSVDDLTSMQQDVEIDGNCASYFEYLKMCFNLQQLLDRIGSPDKYFICNICISKLKESYSFKHQIEKTHNVLFNMLQNHENTHLVMDIKDFDKLLKIEVDGDVENEGRLNVSIEQKKPSKSIKYKYKNKVNLKEQEAIKGKSRAELMKDRDARIYASVDAEDMCCLVCSKRFQTIHVLYQHMNEHFVNYTCEKCGKGFALRRRYMHHLRRHITGFYQCTDCGKTFRTQNHLQNHRGNYHLFKHLCKFCPQRFRSYYKRQMHMRDIHGEVVTYQCDQCTLFCLTKAALNSHVRQKHMARTRSHPCLSCDKEFYTSHSLKRHMAGHDDTKIYKCSECFTVYGRKYMLTQHMKSHCVAYLDFMCDCCGKKFINKNGLRLHFNREHRKGDNKNK